VIGLAIHKTLGFRVSREDELAGVDRSEHAETAYAFAELGFSRFSPFGHHTGAAHSGAAHSATSAHAAGRAPEGASARAKEDSLV
jgi:Amt family ammonium transporter